MNTISERLKAVIELHVPTSKRYKTLADLTGVSAEAWRAYWNGRQKLSAEMLSLISQQWPQYGFWLSTGIPDPENGHIAPGEQELPATTTYFLELLQHARSGNGPYWQRGMEEVTVLESATPSDWKKAQLESEVVNLDLQNLSEMTPRVIEITRQRRLEELKKNREKEKARSKAKK